MSTALPADAVSRAGRPVTGTLQTAACGAAEHHVADRPQTAPAPAVTPTQSITLRGLGTALPALSVSQDEAASIASRLTAEVQPRAIGALYRQAKVQRRYSVLLEDGGSGPPSQSFYQSAAHAEDRGPSTADRMARYAAEAPDLAATACRRALADADLPSSEISHLVTVSCTGFAAPGVDLELISRLGLPAEVSRTHIGFMGCHALLNALRVASAFAAADPAARVLVASVELCSLHHQYSREPQQLVANALFSDGAAAAVVSQCEADRAAGGWLLVDQNSLVLPDTDDTMSWRIGDHGFRMTLSPQVPELISEHLGEWLASWLQTHGLSTADICSWAVHPGGPRILTATAAAAGFDPVLLEP
ncbi:MAG: type III polyketide synthase, partial [Planctomycetaceae bacterium]|nr:type III polyketide synthase [Planctomycetaceae bacterium]